MVIIIISALIVLIGRIMQDILFNLKIEMFNRGKKIGVFCINFFESMVAIYVIKLVIDLINQNIFLLGFLGIGSSLGGIIVIFLRQKMNKKLIGQRKYFVRISIQDSDELLNILKERKFIFTVTKNKFLDGKTRTIIEGSLENRKRKEELKEILRGRENKLVTIIPAREVYWV